MARTLDEILSRIDSYSASPPSYDAGWPIEDLRLLQAEIERQIGEIQTWTVRSRETEE